MVEFLRGLESAEPKYKMKKNAVAVAEMFMKEKVKSLKNQPFISTIPVPFKIHLNKVTLMRFGLLSVSKNIKTYYFLLDFI